MELLLWLLAVTAMILEVGGSFDDVMSYRYSFKASNKKPGLADILKIVEDVSSLKDCMQLCAEEDEDGACLAAVWHDETHHCSLAGTASATDDLEPGETSVLVHQQQKTYKPVPTMPPVENLMNLIGVTCSASSENSASYVCENAFDGVTPGEPGNQWISNNNGDVGAWIQIAFPRTVTIDSVDLWQGCVLGYQYSNYTLTFSDGSEQQMATPCQADCPDVEHRQLTPVETTSVRFTGYGDCSASHYNGFREVVLWGW